MAQPDPVVIEELDVPDAIRIVLDGPDLPYARPRDLAGFDAGGPVEHQAVYFPGRTKPLYQVQQARFRPLQIRGAFRDHLAIREGRPQAGDGYARSQVQQIEELRARANPVRVTWGSYSIQGLLTESRFGFEANDQITYELEFQVASVEDLSDISEVASTRPIDDGGASVAAALRTILAQRAAEAAPMLALMRARDEVIAVQNALDLVDAGLQTLSDAAVSLASASPADILTGALRVAGTARITQIQTDLLRLALPPLDLASRADLPPAQRLAWAQVRLGLEVMVDDVDDQVREVALAARAQVRSAGRVYTVQAGDTLETIARSQLGDASRANELGVRASDLRPGLLVRIPTGG